MRGSQRRSQLILARDHMVMPHPTAVMPAPRSAPVSVSRLPWQRRWTPPAAAASVHTPRNATQRRQSKARAMTGKVWS